MSEVPFNFLGLPPEDCNYQGAKIVILPVPFDMTSSWVRGTDGGPHAIIDASRNVELYDIETDSEAYRHGIYTGEDVLADTSEEMVSQVTDRVSMFLSDEKFVVTLGGEHSVSLGAIKAHLETYPKMSVLHLDAHSDMRDCYLDNPLSHACVMARVKDLTENIVSVGIRSMDREEVSRINRSSVFFAHEIVEPIAMLQLLATRVMHNMNEYGEASTMTLRHDLLETLDWAGRVVDKLNDQVYVSIDLDVFDPSIMPSTGTPEPGGLNWYQVVHLLDRVIQSKQVVGFDVVELCPNPQNHAPDFLAAKLVYRVLNSIFRNPLD